MSLLTGLDDDATAAELTVRIGSESMSGTDLREAASAAARALEGLTRVAVHAVPDIRTVVAVTAGLFAGVEVVPMPPDAGDVEQGHYVSDSEVEAWIGLPPRDPAGLPVIAVDPHARGDYAPAVVDPELPAMILYTSGTTGLPKGVVLSRRAIAAGLDGLAEAWGWSRDDTLVHGLPLFYVHGLILGVLGPLRIGSNLVHTCRPTPEAYAAESAGTIYFGVPTVWARIARHTAAARALRRARLLVSGSAPLPKQCFERIEELTGHRIVERYGMSETLITLSARADGPRREGFVGFPVAGVETRLCDEHGGEVPHDGASLGLLEVRGPTLFSGYLGLPAATAATLREDGWFHTGDIAAIDPEGWHRIVGRESVDLIKTGGYRVGAGEIETILLGHPEVHEVAVVGEPDDDLGQRIVAYVVPRSERSLLASSLPGALITHVAEHLSIHKRPREVRLVPELPRNPLGKVRKDLLSGAAS
jgi:fatty acid CoA ligase FadD36